jgi:5,10-methylenetetrahydrofolate reductase
MGGMRAGTRLERTLRCGHFAVTAEIGPPDSGEPEAVYKRAEILEDYTDAINATDAAGANAHMSSVGVCAILIRSGREPVLQVSCRDKNRIAIQGDLLGAHALGARNVLCLTGDSVDNGDQPEAKPVFDLDSISLLHTARIMRDRGHFLNGRKIESPPNFFLGAASNPFAPPHDFRPYRLAKKVEAGAEFVQTQYCYDIDLLREFMKVVIDQGLHEKVFIMVGVGPLRSAKGAEWMRKNVPGVHIPDAIVERMRGAGKGKQRAEGVQICVDIIEEVKTMEGIGGVHIMAFNMEESVGEIVDRAGLLPRPWQTGEVADLPLQEEQDPGEDVSQLS